jgi:hypothetical protein
MNQLCGFWILIGPAILAWQSYGWLETGGWTALPLSKTLNYFGLPMLWTSWLGLQRIIDWVFDLPTSGTVFVLSFVPMTICAIICITIEDYFDRRKAS